MDRFIDRERGLTAVEIRDVGGMAEYFMNRGLDQKKVGKKKSVEVANNIPRGETAEERFNRREDLLAVKSGASVSDIFEREPY